TLPLSLWMTALFFTSEAPVNDHGAQGKAIHTIIMLLGVGLFTVPMGLFASAFRERLDEMHAKKLRPLLRPERHMTHGRRVSETAMILAEEQYASMIAALTQLEEERAQGNFRRFGEKSSGQDGLNAEGFRDIHDVSRPQLPLERIDDEVLMQLQPDTWKYRWYRLLMGKRHPGIGLETLPYIATRQGPSKSQEGNAI
ncbi:unnamed protein product, partial [Cladocopium goreaui]